MFPITKGRIPLPTDNETMRRYLMYCDLYDWEMYLHQNGDDNSTKLMHIMDMMLHYREQWIERRYANTHNRP